MRTLSPGHQIHWYRIESVLGQGGFGVTYLAHDTNLDRRVAIKEYLPPTVAARHGDDSVRPLSEGKRADFAWGLDNFLAEARTLALFRHENIVGVHSVFEENNTAYMVMVYEQGDSLSALYRRGEYRDQRTLEHVFFPIFDGLGEIHDLGFIHRDIKPANIYIRENGTAVLLDFGAARSMAQRQTGEMTSLVSQGYTPLEQYSVNYGEQGPWTDIYALAATMYEGITGRKPEEALSRSACLLRRRPDPVSPLAVEFHPAFEARFLDAVFAGLALQPEERPSDLDAWLERFRGDLSGVNPDDFDALDERTRLFRRAERAEDDDRTVLRRPSHPSPRSTVSAASSPNARTPTARPSVESMPLVSPAFPNRDDDREPRNSDPSTSRAASGRSRPRRRALREDRTKDRRGRGRAVGLLVAMSLLAGVGVAGWWYFERSVRDAPVAPLDLALIDTLPEPREMLSVAPRAVEVARRLDDMGTLASLYRQADAAGAADERLEAGARNLREQIEEIALEWHPQRHPDIVGRIERVATLLPERVAERASLQRLIDSANERSDLDAARSLLAANAITEPAGDALIDRIGRLDNEDYRALVDSPAWARLMSELGNAALERVRAARFDDASLLVRAALTLQPDEPFMRRLGEHLGGGEPGS